MLHLVEEIKTGFRHKLPFGPMPKPVFIGVNAGVYTFCFVTLFLSLIDSQLAVPLGWVLASGMLLNGLGHISIMVFKGSYFPGGITAFLLALVAVFLMVYLLIL